MSTTLKTIKGRKETEFGYITTELHLTRFSGGENGRMVQFNITPDRDRGDGIQSATIQLTREQAIELVNELNFRIIH